MDELFQQHKLTRLEFDVPEIGFYTSSQMPLAHVKRWSNTSDRLNHPMKVCWSYSISGGTYTFTRELQQEITKPLNIHLSMTKTPGFNYRLKQKENVVISRLLVDPRDIDEAINLLIDEANRFYILYCHTS
jgi:hypothetical protein